MSRATDRYADVAAMTPEEFLALLWTETPGALIELWALRGRHSRYARVPGDAAAMALAGRTDIYTGVALSRVQYPHHRRAPLAARCTLAGLWLDLDVGGRGQAPTKEAALEVARAVLEPTLVIDSGNGLHAWHLLDAPWEFSDVREQQQAAAAAEGWQARHRALAAERGWTIDHTHDLCRLLRIPGTINGKDPRALKPVEVREHSGVRYTRARLLELSSPSDRGGLPCPSRSGPGRSATIAAPRRDRGAPAKLDALRENSPEFQAALAHLGHATWTQSEWDLSVCSQAARAGWTDQELADLIAWHRAQWGKAEKGQRVGYLQRTVALARAGAERDDARAEVMQLARMAA